MKTTSIVILCIYMCINTFGQNLNRFAIAGRITVESICNEKSDYTAYTDLVYPEKSKIEDNLSLPDHNQSRLPGKFNMQKLNYLFLITGASVISILDNLPGQQVSAGNIFTGKTFYTRGNEFKTNSRLALTRLAIIAGSISLINSFKKENRAGLKLACQKTSFGAPNKACKKVTGLTFAISI